MPSHRQNTLLYLCFGKETYARQAIFSMESARALSAKGGPRIVVYTDNEAIFAGTGAECEPMDADLIRQWSGTHGYHFRSKLCCLDDYLSRNTGTVIFCDTDTFFMKDPDLLFRRVTDEQFVMHIPEMNMRSTPRPELRTLMEILSAEDVPHAAHVRADRSAPFLAWNSGVIGMRDTDRQFVTDAIDILDYVLDRERNVHTVEQIALSVALSRRRIAKASDVVFHYWFQDIKDIYSDIAQAYCAEAASNPEGDRRKWFQALKSHLPLRYRLKANLKGIMHGLGFNRSSLRTSS